MQQQPRLPLWFFAANGGIVLLAFVLGLGLRGLRIVDLPDPQGTALQLIYREILEKHVEPQDGQALLDRAIGAMVGGLDEYSQYVPPSEVRAYDERSTGRYEGVGLLMHLHGEAMVVYYPFPGGPAAAAGVRPGDRILAVDGKRLDSLPGETRSRDASELVRGPADTDVRLLLQRGDGEVELVVRRGAVQRRSVKWAHIADPEQRLGYVYVSDFHRGVTQEVKEAIEAMQKDGPLRGLVVDLRFDGGGSLDECVALARTFVAEGTIVTTRRRGSEVVEQFDADPRLCRFGALPMVVLVDEGSASASEVFAGCLQDHARAAIVGVRTYGKGFVNTVYSWKDFRLKLTTAHYYTPNGRNIERRHRKSQGNGRAGEGAEPPAESAEDTGGIVPDVTANVTKEQRRAIHAVLLEQHEPPAAYREAFAAVAAAYGVPVPAPPRADADPQLAQALATLRQRVADAGKGPTEPPKDR